MSIAERIAYSPKIHRLENSRRHGLSQSEARALTRLRKQLRAILPNGELKSLYLYGSKTRGDAHPHSDIDVFVVYGDVTDKQTRELMNLAAIALSKHPQFHLMLYHADELERDLGSSPLIYNISHHGILLEGIAVPKQELDRRKATAPFSSKARRNLQSAQIVLGSGDYDNTISLADYAADYAADAALASKGLVAQSHSGTETLLTIHFIRTGLIDESFKGLLGRAHQARLQADYPKDAAFTQEDAEYWLTRATDFVETIESGLEAWLAGPPALK